MLKESEWITINQILLEIYSIQHLDELTERLFKMFCVLVPYTKGYFIVFSEQNRINIEKSFFIHMNDEIQDKYLNYFYDMDYLNYIMEYTADTSTYRDTDILDDSIRKNTKFFKEFLRPQDIPYGCGIVLFREHKIIGIINLFRSWEMGDFSDKEMYILDILKLHLENITINLTIKEGQNQEIKIERLAARFQLSVREQQVVKLMERGFSNNEIKNTLSISLSTVKKHAYNIYSKTGAKSRTQLLAMLHK